MYLSKGTLCRGSNDSRLYIRHLGAPVELTGAEARLWLAGMLGFAFTASEKDETVLQRLVKNRLAYSESEHSDRAQYWILRHCVICPTGWISFSPLCKREKTILIWLKKAGFHLSIAELIYLFEKEIEPRKDLLYAENRLVLSRLIYPHRVMIVHAFENRMLHSITRKQTVDGVMNLLKRKQVVMM